jgi:hypothetical protein
LRDALLIEHIIFASAALSNNKFKKLTYARRKKVQGASAVML